MLAGDEVIEAVGKVVLSVGADEILRANGDLIAEAGGNRVNRSAYVSAGWTPVAADRLNGTNTLVWRHAGDGYLHFWRMSDSWRAQSSDGWQQPGGSEYYATESAFSVDIDGDGAVGVPGGMLSAGGSLLPGKSIVSPHGDYRLVMQTDGTLAVYGRDSTLRWHLYTGNNPGTVLAVQKDGNMVMYHNGTAVWYTGTQDANARLRLDDDGTLALYSGSGAVLWSAGELVAGSVLMPGQTMSSPNEQYYVQMRGDGALAVYDRGWNEKWYVSTNSPGAFLVVQKDGNLVLYKGSTAVWSTGTYGNEGARLRLGDDGTLALYSGSGVVLWRAGELVAGSVLMPGQTMSSPNEQYYVQMRGDGALAVYDRGWNEKWYVSTNSPGAFLVVQKDGNLVLYKGSTAVWSTGTYGNEGARLRLGDDGTLALYSGSGVVLWRAGELVAGSGLQPGQTIASSNGQYRLVMQSDGNLVCYGRDGSSRWSSQTAGIRDVRLVMQGDGNLVLYSGSTPVWSTNTWGHAGAHLQLGDTGVLDLIAANGGFLWSTGSQVVGGSSLREGESITSPNGQYRLVMQTDGNLVLYRQDGTAIWSSRTYGIDHVRLQMQSDGNLVLYSDSTPVWATGTWGHAGAYLSLTDLGDMKLLSKTGDIVWTTGSHIVAGPSLNASESLLSPTINEDLGSYVVGSNVRTAEINIGEMFLGNLRDDVVGSIVWNIAGTVPQSAAFLVIKAFELGKIAPAKIFSGSEQTVWFGIVGSNSSSISLFKYTANTNGLEAIGGGEISMLGGWKTSLDLGFYDKNFSIDPISLAVETASEFLTTRYLDPLIFGKDMPAPITIGVGPVQLVPVKLVFGLAGAVLAPMTFGISVAVGAFLGEVMSHVVVADPRPNIPYSYFCISAGGDGFHVTGTGAGNGGSSGQATELSELFQFAIATRAVVGGYQWNKLSTKAYGGGVLYERGRFHYGFAPPAALSGSEGIHFNSDVEVLDVIWNDLVNRGYLLPPGMESLAELAGRAQTERAAAQLWSDVLAGRTEAPQPWEINLAIWDMECEMARYDSNNTFAAVGQ